VYPVLNPDFGKGYIGGESVQHTLLARAFRRLGWDATVVDVDYGQEEGEFVCGIRVRKTFSPEAGIPGLRFFHPRLTGIWRALDRADADVYFQSCAGMLTGVAAAFCQWRRRTFLFRTAHDTDCIPGQALIRLKRDRWIYEFGLRRADWISVQGSRQEALLRRHYGLESIPVPMAAEPPESRADGTRDIDVLWVNNMRPFKRPELAVELARRLSVRGADWRMVMIGGPAPGMESYYEEIRSSASAVPGLDFLGPVPYREVNGFFRRAKLFVNTSESEGFPNSFLQAWIRGVPVISFFDPDGLIDSKNLGGVPRNLDEMALLAQSFLESPSRLERLSREVAHFAEKRFSPVEVARRYVEILKGMGI
jgi:glycosyltransferase involved in cell wall biosynthesis